MKIFLSLVLFILLQMTTYSISAKESERSTFPTFSLPMQAQQNQYYGGNIHTSIIRMLQSGINFAPIMTPTISPSPGIINNTTISINSTNNTNTTITTNSTNSTNITPNTNITPITPNTNSTNITPITNTTNSTLPKPNITNTTTNITNVTNTTVHNPNTTTPVVIPNNITNGTLNPSTIQNNTNIVNDNSIMSPPAESPIASPSVIDDALTAYHKQDEKSSSASHERSSSTSRHSKAVAAAIGGGIAAVAIGAAAIGGGIYAGYRHKRRSTNPVLAAEKEVEIKAKKYANTAAVRQYEQEKKEREKMISLKQFVSNVRRSGSEEERLEVFLGRRYDKKKQRIFEKSNGDTFQLSSIKENTREQLDKVRKREVQLMKRKTKIIQRQLDYLKMNESPQGESKGRFEKENQQINVEKQRLVELEASIVQNGMRQIQARREIEQSEKGFPIVQKMRRDMQNAIQPTLGECKKKQKSFKSEYRVRHSLKYYKEYAAFLNSFDEKCRSVYKTKFENLLNFRAQKQRKVSKEEIAEDSQIFLHLQMIFKRMNKSKAPSLNQCVSYKKNVQQIKQRPNSYHTNEILANAQIQMNRACQKYQYQLSESVQPVYFRRNENNRNYAKVKKYHYSEPQRKSQAQNAEQPSFFTSKIYKNQEAQSNPVSILKKDHLFQSRLASPVFFNKQPRRTHSLTTSSQFSSSQVSDSSHLGKNKKNLNQPHPSTLPSFSPSSPQLSDSLHLLKNKKNLNQPNLSTSSSSSQLSNNSNLPKKNFFFMQPHPFTLPPSSPFSSQLSDNSQLTKNKKNLNQPQSHPFTLPPSSSQLSDNSHLHKNKKNLNQPHLFISPPFSSQLSNNSHLIKNKKNLNQPQPHPSTSLSHHNATVNSKLQQSHDHKSIPSTSHHVFSSKESVSSQSQYPQSSVHSNAHRPRSPSIKSLSNPISHQNQQMKDRKHEVQDINAPSSEPSSQSSLQSTSSSQQQSDQYQTSADQLQDRSYAQMQRLQRMHQHNKKNDHQSMTQEQRQIYSQVRSIEEEEEIASVKNLIAKLSQGVHLSLKDCKEYEHRFKRGFNIRQGQQLYKAYDAFMSKFNKECQQVYNNNFQSLHVFIHQKQKQYPLQQSQLNGQIFDHLLIFMRLMRKSDNPSLQDCKSFQSHISVLKKLEHPFNTNKLLLDVETQLNTKICQNHVKELNKVKTIHHIQHHHQDQIKNVSLNKSPSSPKYQRLTQNNVKNHQRLYNKQQKHFNNSQKKYIHANQHEQNNRNYRSSSYSSKLSKIKQNKQLQNRCLSDHNYCSIDQKVQLLKYTLQAAKQMLPNMNENECSKLGWTLSKFACNHPSVELALVYKLKDVYQNHCQKMHPRLKRIKDMMLGRQLPLYKKKTVDFTKSTKSRNPLHHEENSEPFSGYSNHNKANKMHPHLVRSNSQKSSQESAYSSYSLEK